MSNRGRERVLRTLEPAVLLSGLHAVCNYMVYTCARTWYTYYCAECRDGQWPSANHISLYTESRGAFRAPADRILSSIPRFPMIAACIGKCQRGTPPGERGREKENRSKNRHFPPSSPDRRPSPLSASLTSPHPVGSHPLRFSSLDSLFPPPPFSLPLPVFAFVRTRRLKPAIARAMWNKGGLYNSSPSGDTIS